VDHGGVPDPAEPLRNAGGQISSKQLGGQRVQGAQGDAHVHVHAAGSDEEAHALGHNRVDQQEDEHQEEQL